MLGRGLSEECVLGTDCPCRVQPKRVLIFGLDPWIDESGVFRLVQNSGSVVEIELVKMDGFVRCCFVEMGSNEQARVVLDYLDETVIDGRRLKVIFPKQRGRLSSRVKQEQLQVKKMEEDEKQQEVWKDSQQLNNTAVTESLNSEEMQEEKKWSRKAYTLKRQQLKQKMQMKSKLYSKPVTTQKML